MEKKRILLFVDFKNRDLRPLVHLKILLEKKGYIVKVCSLKITPLLEIFEFLPHVVVFPQILTQSMMNLCRFAKRIGSLIVDLSSEGVFSDAEVDHEIFVGKYVNMDLLDLKIVWGRVGKEVLLEYNTVPEKKIKICGSPKFDDYKPPLSTLLMSKESFCRMYNLNPQFPIVVWATGYGSASREPVVSSQPEWFAVFDKLKYKFELEKRLRDKTLEAFSVLVKEIPHANFIIKLHPCELWSEEYYRRFIRDNSFDHVRFISKKEIFHLIGVTDVLLHYNSTVSTEVWCFNKPTITMGLTEDSEILRVAKGGDIVRNTEQLVERVKYYLNGGAISQDIQQFRNYFLEESYYRIDGKSTQRCCDAISELIEASGVKINKEEMIMSKEEIIGLINQKKRRDLLLRKYRSVLNRDGFDRVDPKTAFLLENFIDERDVKAIEYKMRTVLGIL
jgi:surface carbohydrate biosynthesis protein